MCLILDNFITLWYGMIKARDPLITQANYLQKYFEVKLFINLYKKIVTCVRSIVLDHKWGHKYKLNNQISHFPHHCVRRINE